MFYGLNKFIKNFLPKRLFYRSLIIVAAPIILLQITITIVFFDSIWIKANKGMTRSLVSEIVTIIDIYNNENEENKKIITDLYNQNFNFSVRFLEEESLPNIRGERWFSPMDRTLRRELKSRFNEYWFSTTAHKELIDLRIIFKNGILPIILEEEKIKELSEYSKRKQEISIDLKEEKIFFGNKEIKFEIDSFKRKCLLEGLDDIALSLEKSGKISSFEKSLKNKKPWIFND